MRALIDGRDTLVVMTTGSGKSAIYQIANIEEEQPGEAAAIDASVSETKREERLEELADEELEFLFLAPEQLARAETVERLAAANATTARPAAAPPSRASGRSRWARRSGTATGTRASCSATTATGS